MEELIKQNLPALMRFATALTGDRFNGEDLVHSTIEKIIKKYPNIDNGTEFLKLSYRIIRNQYIDDIRKGSKIDKRVDVGNISYSDTLDLDETIRIKTMSPEEKIIENEIEISRKKQYEIAESCLLILDNEMQKSVLILFSEGLKYAQISLRLEIPEGTVKSNLARARMKVAKCIKERLKNER